MPRKLLLIILFSLIGSQTPHIIGADIQQKNSHIQNQTKKITVLQENQGLKNIQITIDNDTTIADIKKKIECKYLIGQDHQSITAAWKTWWLTLSGWALQKSEILDDKLTVKDVLIKYNTSMLHLHSVQCYM